MQQQKKSKKKKVEVSTDTHFTIYQRMSRLRLLPTKAQMMEVGFSVKKIHDEEFSDLPFTYQKEAQELPDQKNVRYFEVRWYSKKNREFIKKIDEILKALDCPKRKRERKKVYVSTKDDSKTTSKGF